MTDLKISQFVSLVFGTIIVASGVALGFFADSVHQRWLSFIAMGICLIGFLSFFYGYFSILGIFAQGLIDVLKFFIDGLKSFFKK